MSTNKQRLYTKADIENAKAESNAVRRYFARKSKRRKTVQVRVGKYWHTKLKEFAHSEDYVMSFLLDKICELFFKHYK
jgi:molybdopterin/thiamine biosynthesis adenylyltransferase